MSLGFRRDALPITPRTVPHSTLSTSSSPTFSLQHPKGILPLLVQSLFSLAFPLLFFYRPPDLPPLAVRGIFVGLSAGMAFGIVLANDNRTWFNIVFFFHLGVVLRVVDIAIRHAYDTTTSDMSMVSSLTAAVVLTLHALPFLISNHVALRTGLGMVGIVAGAATTLVLDPSLMLVLFASSVGVLVLHLVTRDRPTAVLGEIKTSLRSGQCCSWS